MTIDQKIRDEKLQYYINREAGKIFALPPKIEWFYEIGSVFLSAFSSVCLSILLSPVFLELAHQIFSEPFYAVKDSCGDMHGRAQFFWKNPFPAKMTKKGEKWPKKGVFGVSRKI